MPRHHLSPWRPTAAASALTVFLLVTAGSGTGRAGLDLPRVAVFYTELTSFNLTGGPYNMPLGPGFTGVPTNMSIMLAAPAPGTADVYGFNQPASTGIVPGQRYLIDSVFNPVSFKVTMTTTAATPFFGMPGLTTLGPLDGSASMHSQYYQQATDEPGKNYGLIPPPASAPYIGHTNIVVPLGDVDGDSDIDYLKFTLVQHTVGNENRTFIQNPDGTITEIFDSSAALQGAVTDILTDPPFSIGFGSMGPFDNPNPLTGPTTARSNLNAPLPPLQEEGVPEPGTVLLVGAGLAALGLARRWRRAD